MSSVMGMNGCLVNSVESCTAVVSVVVAVKVHTRPVDRHALPALTNSPPVLKTYKNILYIRVTSLCRSLAQAMPCGCSKELYTSRKRDHEQCPTRCKRATNYSTIVRQHCEQARGDDRSGLVEWSLETAGPFATDTLGITCAK